eukprot:7266114-Pyramimonas_sp.AAC.1
MKRKDAAAGSTADDAASVVTGRRGAKKTKAEAGDAKGPKAGWRGMITTASREQEGGMMNGNWRSERRTATARGG